MDQARAERAAKPDLGSAAEPLALRSGSPAGAKRANARQHDLAISRPDCPLRHRTGHLHERTFLPRGPVRPSSLARPLRLTSSVHSTTRPSGAGAAASPRSSSSALRQAPLCLPLPRLAGSVRQHRRPLGGGMNSARREANGMTAGARKTPGARQAPPGRQAPRQSPSRCANRSGQTRRARNGGSAPRPLPLTTGNFPSAAPGPRPVARAPDSRCGRPVHRVRWPAPGRRYPAHCG